MRAVSSLLVAFAVWLAASPGATIAQPAYPTRPVKVIVPSAAGGGIDIVGRVLAENLSRATGQQFYVENRSGAGNMIGMEAVAKNAISRPSLCRQVMAVSLIRGLRRTDRDG